MIGFASIILKMAHVLVKTIGDGLCYLSLGHFSFLSKTLFEEKLFGN